MYFISGDSVNENIGVILMKIIFFLAFLLFFATLCLGEIVLFAGMFSISPNILDPVLIWLGVIVMEICVLFTAMVLIRMFNPFNRRK